MFRMFCFALFMLCPLSAEYAHALTVKDVRVGLKTDHTRIVFDLDAPAKYNIFTLSDPSRVVIDIPSASWRVPQKKTMKNTFIRDIRYGQYTAETSRIAIDVNGTASVKKHFILDPDRYGSYRLVVDIKHATIAYNAGDLSRQSLSQKKKKALQNNITVTTGETLTFSETAGNDNKNRPVLTIADTPALRPVPQMKPDRRTGAKATIQKDKPLIVIDPGHGGVDPGAIAANKVYEKDVVLKLAQNLKMKLDATGRYRVKLTREDDRFIKLRDRVKFARNHDADLFISLHADSLGSHDTHGSSVYTLSDKASDEETAQLAARENRVDLIGGVDLNVADEDVANILVDLAMRDTQNHSNYLANTVVAKFKAGKIDTLRTAHRSAGFAVLKAPDIPSILVEAGFLSNAQEAKRLNTPAYRSQIANALTNAVNTFFDARIAAQ